MIHCRNALSVFLFLLCPSIFGQDDLARQSLKGITNVAVTVEDLPAELQKAGLTKSQIQTDIEVKLRLAGIGTSSEASTLFAVEIQSMKPGDLPFRFCILWVGIEQPARLTRDPNNVAMGITWHALSWALYGEKDANTPVLRNGIRDLVDRFVNDYLTVNPKK
jgi:hypothetical protein